MHMHAHSSSPIHGNKELIMKRAKKEAAAALGGVFMTIWSTNVVL
jgi:hypothetical protein